MPDPRRASLTAALGFLRYPPRTRALATLHQWLDSWSGIGLIVVGMERYGYTVSLRKVADRWVASFHHDPMSAPKRLRIGHYAMAGRSAGRVGGGEASGVSIVRVRARSACRQPCAPGRQRHGVSARYQSDSAE